MIFAPDKRPLMSNIVGILLHAKKLGFDSLRSKPYTE